MYRLIAAAALAVTVTLPVTAEEVVVTARRSTTAALDVPGSIGRLDRQTLADLDARHQADALNRIAGVEIQRGSGAESLTAIRSPVLTGPGACGAFLLLEDGVPVRPVGFCNVNGMFELNYEQADAIEVLRGPGPIAYGSNAVHGVVNVLSAAPARAPNGPPRRALGLHAGAAGYRRLTGQFGARADQSLLGIYGVATHDGGFRAESGLDEAKLNLSLTRPVDAGTFVLRAAGTVLNQETAGFIRGQDSFRDRALAESNPNPEAFRDAWSSRLTATYSATPCESCSDFFYATLRSSWMRFSQHFLIGKPLETNSQTSAAAGLSITRAAGDRWTWTAAADLDWSDAALDQFQPGPALDGSPAARAIRPAGKQYDYVVNGLTTGAALGLDWRINDALRASLGVRADSTRYDYDNRMLAGNTDENSIPCNGGCLYARPADRADRFTNVSPKFDLHYRLSTRSALYLLANRGFRPPEMTELYRLQRQQRIASLASEQLDSAEFGVKHERPLLSARLAVYDMRKRNAILRDANGFNVSDGATSHRGVEYEWRWLPSESITLSGAGSWARHRYEFSRAIEAGETIVAGNDVDSAPRQLHSIALAWRPSEHVRLALDARYLGRYFLDAANTATYPGHTVMNGAIAWQLDADWRLNLRIENLLDRVYADRADFAFGDYRYFPARRRAAYLSIDFATP